MKAQGFKVSFGGEDYTLPVNFAALRACAKAGACPLTVVTRASAKQPPNAEETFAAVDVGLALAGVKDPAKAYANCRPVEVYNAGVNYLMALVSGMQEDSPSPKGEGEPPAQ
jgi:hypothetical protein